MRGVRVVCENHKPVLPSSDRVLPIDHNIEMTLEERPRAPLMAEPDTLSTLKQSVTIK